jgi:hypothetical protein
VNVVLNFYKSIRNVFIVPLNGSVSGKMVVMISWST